MIVPDSDAGELGFVQSTVHPILQLAGTVFPEGLSWTSDGFYAAVLLKAGGEWCIFVNVQTGQTIEQLVILDDKDELHDIERIALFVCVDEVE